jgi:hypothetical protein
MIVLYILVSLVFLVACFCYGFHRGALFGINLRVKGLPLVLRIEEEKGVFYAYEWVSGKFLGQNETIVALTTEIAKKIPDTDIIPVHATPLVV